MTSRKHLNVYTCTDFKGYWPVGVAAVVVARDLSAARRILSEALASRGLQLRDDNEIKRVELNVAHALILRDGDY